VRFAVVLGFAALLAAAPLGAWALVQPEKPVDLSRYAGRWYEIARVFNKTERDCTSSVIDYSRDAKGNVAVVQTCHTPHGDKVYRPHVKVLDPGTNAKLRLTYFFVVSKDYWVEDRADDYSWAIVGEPSGRWFWVFARTPTLPKAEAERVITRAKSFGYDTARPIIYDQHPGR